jgi:hypothetical protein
VSTVIVAMSHLDDIVHYGECDAASRRTWRRGCRSAKGTGLMRSSSCLVLTVLQQEGLSWYDARISKDRQAGSDMYGYALPPMLVLVEEGGDARVRRGLGS